MRQSGLRSESSDSKSFLPSFLLEPSGQPSLILPFSAERPTWHHPRWCISDRGKGGSGFLISKKVGAARDPPFHQSKAPGLGGTQWSGNLGESLPLAPPQVMLKSLSSSSNVEKAPFSLYPTPIFLQRDLRVMAIRQRKWPHNKVWL